MFPDNMHMQWGGWLLAGGGAVLVTYIIRRKAKEGAFGIAAVPAIEDKAKARNILKHSVDWGEVLTVSRPDGVKLSMVHAKAANSTHLLVLSHGRGAALTSFGNGVYHCQEVCKAFLGLGVDLLVYDYSGYGASEGERSEAQWLEDCRVVFEYAQSVLKWERSQIIAVGQSVGTGVTIQHLARLQPGYAGLILFHPYRSILSTKSVLAAQLLRPLDLLKSHAWIDKVAGPVLVVHAKQDRTVPYHNGACLAARLEKRGALHKLVTLSVEPPADAHARLFEVEPSRSLARDAVREFVQHLRTKK